MPISPEGDEAPAGTSDDRGTAPTAEPTPDEAPTRPVKARPRSVYDETPPPGEEEEIEEIDAADVDETSQVSHPGVAAVAPTAPPRTPAPARTTRPTPAPPPPGRATRPTPAPIVAAAAAVEFSALPTAEATALLPIEERRRALTAVYQKELAVLDSGARSEAALLQHELGELLGGANNEAEAVKAYAKALQLDPAWKPNLLAIRAIFEERKLWPNLLKLLDAEVRFAVGEPDRAEALVEKGRLLESELKDAVGARAAYEQATQADATCLPAWMALEKMALREGNLSALQTALAGLATATPEPSRKVALLLDLARLQDSVEGGTLDEAFGLCRRAAAVGWEPVRALSMMERLAESAGRHAEMVEALDRQAQLVTAELAHHPASEMVDPENDPRRRLIEELVGLRRRQSAVLKSAGDPAGALAVLEAVAAIAPDDPLLFLDASAQLAAAGRFADLAQMMALRGARWADAAAQPGGDVVLPLRARWERARVAALRAAGRSDEAAALEASIGDERALDVLLAGERDALTTGDAAKLVTIYQAEAKLAVDAGEPAWAVGALIRAAALTGRQLGRTEEAALLLKSALALVPHHLGVVAQLDQLYAQASQPAARAQLLSAELAALDAETTPAGAPPAERRWRWLSTLADLYQIDLNDAASALATVRRLVALRPDDARGQLRLVELLRTAAETDETLRDELVAALSRAAALVKDDARVALQMERADLLARHGRPEAAAAFAEILAESPSNSRARAAYARLCRARGTDGLADLAASLRREADATLQGPRAIEVLLELADLEEHERGDRVAAAKVYRDLLDRAPGHAAAVRGLVRTLTATGDRRAAADAREQELDSLTISAKVAALVALGEDHEEAGASGKPESETLLEQADDAYRRALEIVAGRPAEGDGLVAAALLGRLRTGLQRREATVQRAALAELLTLPSSAEAEVAAALFSEAALVELRAGDLGAAAAQLAKASAASATAVAPLLGEALLGAREGASVELAGVLERWSARTNDNDLRAALLRRAGWMTLAKGRRAEAVTLLRAARQADPRDALTLMALAETDANASELEARAQLAEGVERVAWLVEAAEAAERSGDLKEAGRLALAAHAIDPLDVGALLVARRVARAASDLAGFAEATVRLAEQLLEAERSAALFNEAGAAFEEVGQSESAALAYRAVLDRTPLDGSAWRRARALLGERYQSAGDAGPLLELLDHRLASLHDAADRTAALLDRAALLEKEGDWAGAERDLRALLESAPEERTALSRLARLRSDDPAPTSDEETVELWGRYLALEEDPEPRRAAFEARSRIEERRGHFEQALEGLDEAQDLQPRIDTAEHRVELLVKLGRTDELKEALARTIALAKPGPERGRVELRAAQLYEDRLADPRAAAESIARALDQDPLSIDGLSRYVNLAESGHVHGLEAQDRLDRALAGLRVELQTKSRQPQLYSTMARLWGWRGDDDLRTLSLQAEALVGGQPVPPRGGALEPTKELTPAGWERLIPAVAHSVALDIWRIMAPATVKMFGPDLATVASRRLNAKGIPMAFIPVDKIVRSLAGADYELHQGARADACLVVGNALVVGQDFADRLTNSTRFAVARAAALLKERQGGLDRMSDDETRLFFAACARIAEVPKPRSVASLPDGAVEERAKVVAKALGRKERAALKALAGRWTELPDPAEFRASVLDGVARAALVVGADLQSALEQLRLPLNSDGAIRFVEFAVSSDFLSLRRELGLKG